ncbi:MAG: TonB family protein [Flavobacteriaceae bacterium]|jgi:TonB family protein
MQANITKIIDQYLHGELSADDKTVFEERLADNPELRQELALQQDIHEAAQRASFRADIKHVGRRYRLNRILKMSATGLGIIAIIAMSGYFIQNGLNDSTDVNSTTAQEIALEQAEKLNEFVQFDNVPVQYFSIPEEGDFKLSEEGVLLSVPENAFTLNGAPYSGPSILQYQEAIDAATIIKGNLNTMAGDQLLETQGMFSIQAYTPQGKELQVNPSVGIYVQVPVDECKSGMQLYEGVALKDGTIDWQNPVPLEKIPLSIPMNELDFYPVGYEAKLDETKWKKNKQSRDSLYLSFEVNHGNVAEPINAVINPRAAATHPNGAFRELNSDRATNTDPNVVFFPELEAQFPGGSKALRMYIAKNTKYPQYAILQGQSGTVYVSFTTNQRGKIENALVEESVSPALDKEALRLVNNMPNWVPAQENAMPVRAMHRIPIKFMLEGDQKNQNPYNNLVVSVSSPQFEDVSVASIYPDPQVEPHRQLTSPDISDTNASIDRYPFVSPSKVLALWNSKFNKTNLATREFERRMKAIHSTCSDAVLAKYTRQLSKPISEIDREVSAMGYGVFDAFAAEQIGAVNPGNPHLINLQKFYDQGIKALRKEAKKSNDWEQKLRNQRDLELTKQRNAHSARTIKNKRASGADEKALNTKRILKETRLNGPNRTIRQSPTARPSAAAMFGQFNRTASFTVTRSGSHNLDRPSRFNSPPAFAKILAERDAQLLDQSQVQSKRRIESISGSASDQRQTVTITENGRTSTILYKDFTFEVPNPEKYVKLFGYLFPNKINSYQLIDCANGDFKQSLNGNIIYDVCIVGITKDGYEYFQKQTLNGGDLGTVKMEQLTERDLEASIRQLNGKRISRPAPILGELDWVRAESNNYREQKRRQDMRTFRASVEETIFPCYSAYTGTASNLNQEESNQEAQLIELPTEPRNSSTGNPFIKEIRQVPSPEMDSEMRD